MYRGTGIFRKVFFFAFGEEVDELGMVVIIEMCGFSELIHLSSYPIDQNRLSIFFFFL